MHVERRNITKTQSVKNTQQPHAALNSVPLKARAESLLSVIELLFLSLTVEALQGKMCQN